MSKCLESRKNKGGQEELSSKVARGGGSTVGTLCLWDPELQIQSVMDQKHFRKIIASVLKQNFVIFFLNNKHNITDI